MPSTYAHHVFSKKVQENLPESLSHICQNYETQFQFGSQGPDFLYFYHPARKNHYTETGTLMHNCTLSRFLKSIIPILKLYGTDSMEYAYTLGFICHFALDSFCHPYVTPNAKRLSISHIAMETEFDRYLLEKDGEEPLRYPLHQLIPNDTKTQVCLHHLYPDVPEEVIGECVKTYRFYRKLWITPNQASYFITKVSFRFRHRYGYFSSFLMPAKKPSVTKETNPALFQLYNEASKAAVSYLTSFHESFTKNLPLDKRFDRNFK
ncbi:MAG: zinc dependent phospholipase C family protein [Lachnospiraceae bacterium]|nr:zinc dependent phospholipase C family protein [Lachnospiraceae bacterium]